MSRSGYTEGDGPSDEHEQWAMIRERGAYMSAVRGRRGQAFLVELRDALRAMPEKRLAAHSFQTESGEVCTLGCVFRARGVPIREDIAATAFEGDDVSHEVAELLGIPRTLAAQIMWENDEFFAWTGLLGRSPIAEGEARYRRMLALVEGLIRKPEEVGR